MKCPVCKESYDRDSRKSTRLSCGHHICQNCREKSTNRKWKCCYCKNVVDLDEPGKTQNNSAELKVVVKKANKAARRIDELECHECHENLYEQEMKYCEECRDKLKNAICESCVEKNHKNHNVTSIYPFVKSEREIRIRQCLEPHGIKVIKLFNDIILAAENRALFEEKELKNIVEEFNIFMLSAGIVPKSFQQIELEFIHGRLDKKTNRIVQFLVGRSVCVGCFGQEIIESVLTCSTCRDDFLCRDCQEIHKSHGHRIEELYLTDVRDDEHRKDLGLFHPVIYPKRKFIEATVLPKIHQNILSKEWILERMAQVARVYLIHASNKENSNVFDCFRTFTAKCSECQHVYNKKEMIVCGDCTNVYLLINPSTMYTFDPSKMALCEKCAREFHRKCGHQTFYLVKVELNQNSYERSVDKPGDVNVETFQDIVKIPPNHVINQDIRCRNLKCSSCETEKPAFEFVICENCVNEKLSKKPETYKTIDLEKERLCKKCADQKHIGHQFFSYSILCGSRIVALRLSEKLSELNNVQLRTLSDMMILRAEFYTNPCLQNNISEVTQDLF